MSKPIRPFLATGPSPFCRQDIIEPLDEGGAKLTSRDAVRSCDTLEHAPISLSPPTSRLPPPIHVFRPGTRTPRPFPARRDCPLCPPSAGQCHARHADRHHGAEEARRIGVVQEIFADRPKRRWSSGSTSPRGARLPTARINTWPRALAVEPSQAEARSSSLRIPYALSDRGLAKNAAAPAEGRPVYHGRETRTPLSERVRGCVTRGLAWSLRFGIVGRRKRRSASS